MSFTVCATARSLPNRFQDAAGRYFPAVLKRSSSGFRACGHTRPACPLPRSSRIRGLRSSILGTCRNVLRYSSSDSLRCLPLIRHLDAGAEPSFSAGSWIPDCSVTVGRISFPACSVTSPALSGFSHSGRSCDISVPVIASHRSLSKLFLVAIIFEF